MTMTLSFKQKFGVWFGIIMHYLLTFGTPIISAYFLLAQDKFEENGKGGIFFYLIIAVFGTALIIGLVKLISKQKSNLIKTMFRWSVKMAVLGFFMIMINYIDYNIESLLMVLYTAAGGFFLGFLIESYLVLKYKEYIREVGVF